jgi:hypothetical protein
MNAASRWVPVAGLGSSALTLYALVGPPWPPPGDAAAAIWQAQVADQSNRLWLLGAALAAIVAGILFLAFMSGLREYGLLAQWDWLAAFAYGCGLVFVVSIIAAWAAWVSIPAGVQISGEPVPSGELIRFFNDLGQAFVAFPAPLCAGGFAVALATDAQRTSGLPRWLSRSGFVVGIAQVAGILFFPLLLFPIWTALVGVVLVRSPSSGRRTSAHREVTAP